MAIGGVLGQKEGQAPYTIYFIRKKLTLAELNYTVTGKRIFGSSLL